MKSLTITYTPAAVAPDAPTFSPASGDILKGSTVTISAATGTTIYYTIGAAPADPTSSSTEYTAPIAINEATTIKAIAVKDGLSSTVASASYTLLKPTAPTFSVAAKNFDAAFDMTITGPEGTTLQYTTDGSDPATGTAVATNTTTITIPAATTTVKAVSVLNGVSSNVASVTYTYDARTTPTFTLSTTNLPLLVGDLGTVTLTTNHDGTITFTGSDDEHLTVDNTSDAKVCELLADKAGTYTVAVTATGSETFQDMNDVFTVTVSKKTTTTAISTAALTNTDKYAGTAAGSVTATVSYDGTAVDGASVTWSSSDTSVATVNASTGVVTLVAAGTTTLTATYAGNDEYEGSADTYELTVTDTTPKLTFELVTDVNDLAEGDVVTLVYENDGYALGANRGNNYGGVAVTINNHSFEVEGSNTSITRLTMKPVSNSSNWYFQVSENAYLAATSSKSNNMGTAEFGENNAKASISISNNDATIVFQGTNTRNNLRYNPNSGTPLFSCYASTSGMSCPQIYKKAKLANTITATTEYTIDRTKGEEDVTLDATATSGTVTYTVKSSTFNDDEYDFDDGYLYVTATTSGTIVITASAAGTETYKKAADVDITITVIGAKVEPTIAVENVEQVYGSDYTLDISGFVSGDVTLSSSVTEVATVDGLTIKPVAVGTTIITVSTAESAIYKAGSTTFTFTVKQPAGSTTAGTGTTTSEATLDFSDNNEWQFPEGKSAITTDETAYSDGTYSITLAGGGTNYGHYYNTSDKYLMLGQSGATLTFPAFDKYVTQIDVVGRTGASGKVTQNIYVGETAVSTQTTGATGTSSFTIDEAYQAPGNIYTLKVTNANNTQITSIKLHFADPATETVTFNSDGYTTLCSANPIDFSVASEDYTAWRISDIAADGTITFAKIEEAIAGGQGILLHSETKAGESVALPLASSTKVFSETENLFAGALAPVYLSEAGEAYGLSGKTFVKNSAVGTIPAGKAYIPADKIPSEVKNFTFVFEGGITTGIETMAAGETPAYQTFTLAGQRVGQASRLRSGIYVVNGKKVLVK